MKKTVFIIWMALSIGIAICNSNLGITTANTPVNNAKQISSISRVIDTGQNLAYDNEGNVIETQPGDAFYGQDAQYTGVQFSFTESDDGATITDLNTGLIWQRSPTEEQFMWEQAQAYCGNLELADRDDWRTPSLKELISIEDFANGWPYIDTDYFG